MLEVDELRTGVPSPAPCALCGASSTSIGSSPDEGGGTGRGEERRGGAGMLLGVASPPAFVSGAFVVGSESNWKTAGLTI